MSKGLEDFDYDTVGEMLNNISAVAEHAAQHSVQLTALRRVLATVLLSNIVLLAVVLFTIGGN